MSYYITGIQYFDRTSNYNPQGAMLSVICDAVSDLPTAATMQTDTGYTPIIGTTAQVIADSSTYILNSGGTWVLQEGEIFQNVYTKTETDTLLAGKQDTLTIVNSIAQGSTDVITAGGAYDAVYYIANNGFLPASADLNDAAYQTPGRWYYTQGNASTFDNRPNHANFIASIDGGNPAPGMMEFIQVYKSGNVMRGIQRIYISGVRYFMRGYQRNDGTTPPTITWYGWNVYEGTATGSLP